MVRKIYIRVIATLLATSTLCGCDVYDIKGVFVPTSDQVEARFEQSMKMHNGEPLVRIESSTANYSFYACADSHIYDSADNLLLFANTLRSDSSAEFGVMLGDCIERKDMFPTYAKTIAHNPETQSLQQPILTVLGNHDIFFNEWESYKKYVGPAFYYFEVSHPDGCDLYIVLDTATGSLGRKQTLWVRDLLAQKRSSYRHCIVLTHTNFFNTDNSQSASGNLPLEEQLALMQLLEEHKVMLLMQGHDHFREDLIVGGVRYTVVGTIKDSSEQPEWVKVEVLPLDVRYTWTVL